MSKRTKFLLGIGVIAALVIGWQVAAFAVHDTGAFELDGNATNDAAAGDDWDNVCHKASPSDCPNPIANPSNTNTAAAWTKELNTSASIFTGGGSKDPIDINQWAWKDAGGLPDKDNLLHSFAARYSLPPDPNHCPSGTAATCDLLYFGSDRFDNSGDAQQGFWFFQNKVTLGNNKVGGGTGFNGVHKTGDLLIISDFSNGGTVSTISVYSWDTTAPDNLKLLATKSDAKCTTAGDADQFCGLVNANTITMPWSFTDKSGTSGNQALNGEFYEGGVNLSALGLADECFSSVASETRSSTSTSATLKDFVLGQLENCQAGMTTQASTAGPVLPGGTGNSVTDTATISVSGGTNAPDPTGTAANGNPVTFFLCANATNGCPSGGTPIGTGDLAGGSNTNDGTATATSPAVNTQASPLTSGRYCFRAEWLGDTNYPTDLSFTNNTDECFTVQETSSLTTTQSWVPNDSAHVTLGSGGNATSGSVAFEFFNNGTCQGTAARTITDTTVATGGVFETDNTQAITTTGNTEISWRATYNPPANSGITGFTGNCESSTLTIDNDITN